MNFLAASNESNCWEKYSRPAKLFHLASTEHSRKYLMKPILSSVLEWLNVCICFILLSGIHKTLGKLWVGTLARTAETFSFVKVASKNEWYSYIMKSWH